MSERIDFAGIIETTKGYLKEYLTSMGIQFDNKGLFRCFSGEHADRNPSCGLVPHTNNTVFHCFACGVSGNIFLAAHLLEEKPRTGPAFVRENLLYLATRFQVDVPEIKLSIEEQYDFDTYQAYSHASMIVRSSTSERVKSRLTDLGWSQEALTRIGMGTVSSYEDYINKMTKHYGYKIDFLQEIDLTRKTMFNPDNLIFTIKDEHGSPVGFAARNLKFEEEYEEYEAKRLEILAKELDKAEEDSTIRALWKPSKFINSETKTKNHIYQKSKRLFNFDLAKNFAPPLYVFEGYGDAATAYVHGLKNSSAIGSTEFTKEHLELILSTHIDHVIFVLDADHAGEAGTDKLIALIKEHVGGHVGLRVEVVSMPEGSDDPDNFIRKNGAQEFRKLERLDIFTWNVRKGIRDGKDPSSLANETIPLIVNEQNFIRRDEMSRRLAEATGLPREAVWGEVMRLVSSDTMKLDEEKALISRRTAQELMRNAKDAQSIMQSGITQLEVVEKRSFGYDVRNVIRAVDFELERAEQNMTNMGLRTGWPIFDRVMGGLPGKVFVSMPGKPNAGKTTLLDNLAIGLLEHNPDLMILYHTVDDSLSIRIPRLMGAKFNIPGRHFEKSGYFLSQDPEFSPRYRRAVLWLRDLLKQERLVIADVAGLPGTLPSLEGWVRSLRNKFPSRPLVVFGDNFNLYDLPGYDPGEGKVRDMSKFVKRMATTYDCTAVMTMELPKEALRPGVRPRISRIKGSSGMAYDSNCNLGVYSDLKDMGEQATVFWEDPSDQVQVVSDTSAFLMNRRKPIIELVIDKSKISSFDGCIFFRHTPDSGHVEECTENEQVTFLRTMQATGGASAISQVASAYGAHQRYSS